MKLEKIITEKFEKDQQSLKESITALEKKLRRKQNENQNLMDNIEKLTRVELDRVSEIYDLKEVLAERDKECAKLSDDLAVKTKEQIDNIKVKDLECELEELRKALKITTEELWLHKEKLKIETENKKKKESRDMSENNILPKENGEIGKIKNSAHIIEDQREEIELLNHTISRGDEIIKSKDKEILDLKKMIMADQEQLCITEGEYSSLRCMMTEENETVHQVQQEMSRLLQIISDDQESMVLKDKTIADLGLEKDTLNIKISNLKASLKEKEVRLEEAEGNIKKQEDLLEMIETYKGKVKEAMDVIAVKSQQLESYSSEGATDSKEIESLREELRTRESAIQQQQLRNGELENSLSQLHLKLQSSQSALADKDEEIGRLSQEVENERKVAHHVQFTQERELMMKEKEMTTLSKILTEERKVLLEKEEEIKQLNNKVFLVSSKFCQISSPSHRFIFPAKGGEQELRSADTTTKDEVAVHHHKHAGRLLRGSNAVGFLRKVDAAAGMEKLEDSGDDGSDTVTFHDAINHEDTATATASATAYIESDEEDVLLDNLELDEDTDDRLPRKSDINFDQFSLG